MARVKIEVPVEDSATVPAPAAASEPPQPPQPPQVTEAASPRKFPYKKLALVIVIIAGFVFVSNLISEKNKLEQQVKGSQTTNQDTAAIVEQLAKGVELPADETPQMRTIEDAARFTQQNPSLGDIKNGDILLFFEKSQKVVVYRPATQKAVVVVTLAQPTSTDQSQPAN